MGLECPSSHLPEPAKLEASNSIFKLRAVVVAQLAERSLPIPEIHGLNPIIHKVFSNVLICQFRKDQNKGKESGTGPLKNSILGLHNHLADTG